MVIFAVFGAPLRRKASKLLSAAVINSGDEDPGLEVGAATAAATGGDEGEAGLNVSATRLRGEGDRKLSLAGVAGDSAEAGAAGAEGETVAIVMPWCNRASASKSYTNEPLAGEIGAAAAGVAVDCRTALSAASKFEMRSAVSACAAASALSFRCDRSNSENTSCTRRSRS